MSEIETPCAKRNNTPARSTSRAGAVLDPLSSVSICLCSSDNINAARPVSLAMFDPGFSPEPSMPNNR
jgi:hypothetical protein